LQLINLAADAQELTYKSNKHYGLVRLAEKLKSRKTTKILQASSAITYLQNSTVKNFSIAKKNV